jgi:uncharacterized membrane protein YwzB
MELFQDQGLIKIVVVVLALLIAWWAFRLALRWAFRLSRLGCLAILGLAVMAALASRLN